MTDVYLYADETGNLDFEGHGKDGASEYFGFGTAVFNGDHGDALMEGLKLRAEASSHGIHMARGFHAVDDSAPTRSEMFSLIGRQAPRFDTTFLFKANAYPSVLEHADPQMRLYKLAWFLHLRKVALWVCEPEDTLHVIVGTFGTRKRQIQAEAALEDVCRQVDRTINLCVWESATSWGLQVADYALWATHRILRGSSCRWFAPCIKPTLRTTFTPWGTVKGESPEPGRHEEC